MSDIQSLYSFFKSLLELIKLKNKYNKEGNYFEEAKVCNKLGCVYFEMGNFYQIHYYSNIHLGEYDKSMIEHERELKICKKLSDKIGIAVGYRKLAECLTSLLKYDEAIDRAKVYLEVCCFCCFYKLMGLFFILDF